MREHRNTFFQALATRCNSSPNSNSTILSPELAHTALVKGKAHPPHQPDSQ